LPRRPLSIRRSSPKRRTTRASRGWTRRRRRGSRCYAGSRRAMRWESRFRHPSASLRTGPGTESTEFCLQVADCRQRYWVAELRSWNLAAGGRALRPSGTAQAQRFRSLAARAVRESVR